MKRLLQLFCALALTLLLVPAVSAQSDWRELRTQRFAILYANEDRTTAERYGGFVDALYDEVAAVFNHHTATPVTLRLYPTLDRYYDNNPLARTLPGVVAHADYRRHEVVVILPQTQSQTPDEIQNNIRHELAHIVASDLSEGRLNVLFQEGIAQYVEHPSRELEAKIQLLQQLYTDNRLVSWSDLDDRDAFYRDVQISYPESLSIVAFLVERYSFGKLRDLLTITARSSGFRSALERTYGMGVDTLEQEWRAWLPAYLAGGYRRNALVAYDLSPAEALLQQGRYAEAQHELETAIEWLRTTDQGDVLARAQMLLERSIAGQQAEARARDARAALEAADYARAADLVAQAQQAYAALGDTRQDAVLADYAARAERGQRAEGLLKEANALAQSWRYPQARAAADRAAAEYIALGDSKRAERARYLRDFMDQRQSSLGMILLGLGVLGSLVSLWRRLTVREAEAW